MLQWVSRRQPSTSHPFPTRRASDLSSPEVFGSGRGAVEDASAELAQERRSPREPYRDSPRNSGSDSPACGSGYPGGNRPPAIHENCPWRQGRPRRKFSVLDGARWKTPAQNWLRSDDHRVSHIVIAPEIPVLTRQHAAVGIPAATVHQPSIRALGA